MTKFQNRIGRVIPITIQEGSAELSGSHGEAEHIIAVFDAGTYNVQKATCGIYCQTCRGATQWWITDDPFSVPVANNKQLTMHVQYNSGAQYDRTNMSRWSSSNTGVASVNTGSVYGVNAGGVNVLANDPDEPDYSHGCSGLIIECPVNSGAQAQSPGTVAPSLAQMQAAIQQYGLGGVITNITYNGDGTYSLQMSTSDYYDLYAGFQSTTCSCGDAG